MRPPGGSVTQEERQTPAGGRSLSVLGLRCNRTTDGTATATPAAAGPAPSCIVFFFTLKRQTAWK